MWIPKKAQFSGKIVPMILLAFAIVSTIWIYAYNMYLEGENTRLSINIEETKTKITNVQKNPNLQVYKLLTDNKNIIDKLEAQSQVTTFIKRLSTIENKYLLNFWWFSYSAWVITTGVITSSDSSLAPYSIVADFIKWYRKDKNTYFTLPFISQVSGSDTMKFALKFTVKDVLPKIVDDPNIVEPFAKSNKQTILEKIEKRNQKVLLNKKDEVKAEVQQ